MSGELAHLNPPGEVRVNGAERRDDIVAFIRAFVAEKGA